MTDRLTRGNANTRLATYRMAATKHNTGPHKPVQLDWRSTKRFQPGIAPQFPADQFQRSGDGTKWYIADKDSIGEFYGEAHELLRRHDVTGYYVDQFCHDVLHMGVVKLHTSQGTHYIPVTWCDGWDGATAYWEDACAVTFARPGEADHEAAAKDAAYHAYDVAEREAEEHRESNAKDQAEHDIDLARAEIHALNKTVLPLLREVKAQAVTPNICTALRAHIQQLLKQRAEQFALIETRQSDYWTATY